jgi:excisionase family DNA binding protein
MKLLTTQQTSKLLGITPRRVIALVHAGRLPSQRFGKMHLIDPGDLPLVLDRPPGRKKNYKVPLANIPTIE